MAMISIKRYLDLSSADAYQSMLELLIETVTEHPIDIDHAECERFKRSRQNSRDALALIPPGRVFAGGGSH